MPEFHIRSDSVNVEQIMEQIRARIREKRGVDYTEQQIRELAAVKLEKFLDPRGVRSDLLEEFRRIETEQPPPDLPNYAFEQETLYDSHRSLLRVVRRLLQPVLKLFFNPNRLIQALHVQSRLNTILIDREATRRRLERLQFELLHNLVIETTRLGIEAKNTKMRVESLASRLDFSERRVRALEGVVVYKPGAEEAPGSRPSAPSSAPGTEVSLGGGQAEGPGQRSRRRRRRRGRRSGVPAASVMGGAPREGSGPSGSSADATAAREAAGGHDEAAETIERAMAAEALPSEGSTVDTRERGALPPSPGPSDDQQ
jgi:hypothetical protein